MNSVKVRFFAILGILVVCCARPNTTESAPVTSNSVNRDSSTTHSRRLNEPVVESTWLRPSADFPAEPVWGHAHGLRIGLPHRMGPPGIVRIYWPEVTGRDYKAFNFLAIEPVARGIRSLSELEDSQLDSKKGKRLWSTVRPEQYEPGDPTRPVAGIVRSHPDGHETLELDVHCETFLTGAKVGLHFLFNSRRPLEVRIASYALPGSVPLEKCIITATMGNYARLRDLHLEGGTSSSLDLWPAFQGTGFTNHAFFPLKSLSRTKTNGALVIASQNEKEPAKETSPPGGWPYKGPRSIQYWRLDEGDITLDTEACVNGRTTYWAVHAPIPGGVAFENFELVRRFAQGQGAWYGVTTGTVEALRNEADSW